MFSVICVYNNKKILREYLLKSLKTQSQEYELILLDNRDSKYKSAPEALNLGGSRAKGDYLIFVHQDVDFKSETWLEDAEKILEKLNNWGIAGVAGVPQDGVLKSNIENGIPPMKPGEEVDEPTPVQTLDECLVIIPRTIFQNYKFDEELDGWHLYSVDFCLNIKRSGYNVFLLPLHLYHRSCMIHYPPEYYDMLKILFMKYKYEYQKIYTSCGEWKTRYPLSWYKFLNTRVGLVFKNLIDKLK